MGEYMSENAENESLSERTGKLVEKLLTQVEKAVSKNPSKAIEMIDTIRKLAEITGIEKSQKSKLNVVRLPALLSVDEFNRKVGVDEYPCASLDPVSIDTQKPHVDVSDSSFIDIPADTQKSGNEEIPEEEKPLEPGEIDWESFDFYVG